MTNAQTVAAIQLNFDNYLIFLLTRGLVKSRNLFCCSELKEELVMGLSIFLSFASLQGSLASCFLEHKRNQTKGTLLQLKNNKLFSASLSTQKFMVQFSCLYAHGDSGCVLNLVLSFQSACLHGLFFSHAPVTQYLQIFFLLSLSMHLSVF